MNESGEKKLWKFEEEIYTETDTYKFLRLSNYCEKY